MIHVGKYIASNLAHCRYRVLVENFKLLPLSSMDFDLRGLLRRVAEEVEAEIRQVEEELVEVERRARRGGAGRGAVCG